MIYTKPTLKVEDTPVSCSIGEEGCGAPGGEQLDRDAISEFLHRHLGGGGGGRGRTSRPLRCRFFEEKIYLENTGLGWI